MTQFRTLSNRPEPAELRPRERGAAMIIAVLVMVILTLLGVSFLLMAETENKIAENERLAAQALYAAEGGVRQVKRWFDRPNSTDNVLNPPLAAIDRTLRMIDHDGDPSTAAVAQDGSLANPRYKQGIDRDGDSMDDVFMRPYRKAVVDTLLGTETGPDMRISRSTSAGATFLDGLSSALYPGYPGGPGQLQVRISQIDVYAPPYLDISGNWTRYGMGTVKVVAQVVQNLDGTDRVLSEREVKAVLNELPYPGPFGPLHSCANLGYNGDFLVNWGTASSVGAADLTNNTSKIYASLPREIPPGEKIDMLWGYDYASGSSAPFQQYLAELDATGNTDLDDPWFRFLAGGAIADAPNGNDQPYAFDWDYAAGDPLDSGDWASHNYNPDDGCLSNLLQNQPIVSCPEFPYEVWKSIATSGGSNVHYYVWDNGTSFKEDGFGTAQSFRTLTDDEEGLFFFDTTDGVEPYDSDGDGYFDNLTPMITIQGGTWGVRGFVYLNAETFQSKGVTGRDATFRAPGEPWLDIDQDGEFDAGEPWVNLAYATSLAGTFTYDPTDTLQDDGTTGASIVRNTRGPSFTDDAVLWGIFFNNGEFEATGNATYYGSVVAKSGVSENSPAAGTPQFYWDETIKEQWPPDDWDMPRVIITQWETDLM